MTVLNYILPQMLIDKINRLTNNGSLIGGARVAIYTADAIENSEVGLTSGGFILISLLVGGNYNRGVEGIGTGIALGLAQCGYGDELLEVAQTLFPARLDAFLVNWCARIKQELSSNAHGYLHSAHPTLATNITDDFPNRRILGLYVKPLTSWSGIGMGSADRVSDLAASWHSREPSIQNIASFCRLHFGWKDCSKLLDVFQGNLWDGVLCRMLSSVSSLNITFGGQWRLIESLVAIHSRFLFTTQIYLNSSLPTTRLPFLKSQINLGMPNYQPRRRDLTTSSLRYLSALSLR